MARQTLILFFLLWSFNTWAQVEQDPSLDPDSVYMKVFRTLTLKEPVIEEEGWSNFSNHDWEALAYWEVQKDPRPDQMQEAVGDLYLFQSDSTFIIRLRDPQNPQQIGNSITGRYRLPGRKVIALRPTNGREEIIWPIIHLSKDYMVLEVDGLRIFFTQFLSY
ncbi:MAG: hypothetical protein LPK80_06795 [Bacteroidota bacterium]|nr:hypothetical protein [Bacteroidota bacterium]MDX5426909.1 hypothetical protein [Bacteroidota bacterium]MDX5504897.1 hypothetical protein [Bacteroidota bacterium]